MQRNKLTRTCLIVCALLVCAGAVVAQRGKTQRVRFAKGRTTTVLKGAVVRGTQDRYILGASSGQTMLVHITAREKNVAFTILGPMRPRSRAQRKARTRPIGRARCRCRAITPSGSAPRAVTRPTRLK